MDYSTVPFFSFIICVTSVFLFPIILFQLIMSSSSLHFSPLIITFFSLVRSYTFSFPFSLIFRFPFHFHYFFSLLIAIAVVIREGGGACVGVDLVLFCFVLPVHIQYCTTCGGGGDS